MAVFCLFFGKVSEIYEKGEKISEEHLINIFGCDTIYPRQYTNSVYKPFIIKQRKGDKN